MGSASQRAVGLTPPNFASCGGAADARSARPARSGVVQPELTMGNRRETIMRLAKGFFGRRKNCFSLAIRAVEKGLQKAYIGRKLKKRVVRREWIVQIGAGAREHNISYAKLIFGMRYAEIGVNRKILATLAQQAPPPFRSPLPPPSLSLLVPYSFPYLPAAGALLVPRDRRGGEARPQEGGGDRPSIR